MGEASGLDPAAHEDAGRVHAGGLDGDKQLVGDLAVGTPVGEETEDLQLARREPGIGGRVAGDTSANLGFEPA